MTAIAGGLANLADSALWVVVLYLLGAAGSGLLWCIFLVPVIRGIMLARSSGNWWKPFEDRPDGRPGMLAPTVRMALLKAPRGLPRTTIGLTWRWMTWLFPCVVLGLLPLNYVFRAATIVFGHAVR